MNQSCFRTVEVSNPHIDLEGLRFVTVKSRALHQRADICFYVPETNSAAADLIILLHGVYGSHWAWALKGAAHKTAARLIRNGEIKPVVLAMPSDGLWGDGSGYLRHRSQDFEKWVVEEVPQAARETVPLISAASRTFISGLSMGGFGALRIGAKYPRVFAGIGGHSSITHFDQMPLFVEEPLDSYQCPAEDRSVLETMQRNQPLLPAIRFDCGTSDLLIGQNRTLHRELTRLQIPHIYEEFPGGHEWAYWEKHLEDMLRFFSAIKHS